MVGCKAFVNFFGQDEGSIFEVEIGNVLSSEKKDIALLSLKNVPEHVLEGGLDLEEAESIRDLSLDITAHLIHAKRRKLIRAKGLDAAGDGLLWISATNDFTQWIEGGVSGACLRHKEGKTILGIVTAKDATCREALVISAKSISDFMTENGIHSKENKRMEESEPPREDFIKFRLPEEFRDRFNANLTKLLADRIIKMRTDLAKRTLCEACNASPPLTATGMSEAKALLNGRVDSMKRLRKAQVSLIRAGTLDANDNKFLCEIIYLIAASHLGEDEIRHVAWARLNPGKHHGEAVVGTGTRAELIAAGIDGEVPSFTSGGPGEKPVGKFSIPIPPENGPDLNGKLIGSLATYLNEGAASELSKFMAILADKIKESENVSVDRGEDLFAEINSYLRSEREYSQDQRSRYVTIENSTTFDSATRRWIYDLANEILRTFPPLQVVLIDHSCGQHDEETLEILRQVVPENTKNSK